MRFVFPDTQTEGYVKQECDLTRKQREKISASFLSSYIVFSDLAQKRKKKNHNMKKKHFFLSAV